MHVTQKLSKKKPDQKIRLGMEVPIKAKPPEGNTRGRQWEEERAQEMIDNGNVSSARLLLRRAAEFGDARAALLIASSYDPNVLKWDPMTGIVPEPLMARKWYLEAKSLGAGPEVDRRLAALPPVNQ